jgi:hypothetical protein
MSTDNLPNELLELAREHGIDLTALSTELTDCDLEAIVGGKGFAQAGGAIGTGIGGGFRRLLGG